MAFRQRSIGSADTLEDSEMMIDDAEKAATLGSKLAKKLKPPKQNDDDDVIMAWRWFMAIGLTANSIVLVIHILLACGLTPMFSGFAYASELRLSSKELLMSRTQQLEWRMFDLRVRQCESMNKNESATVYTVQLDQLMRQYVEITNSQPRLPFCKELQ